MTKDEFRLRSFVSQDEVCYVFAEHFAHCPARHY
jgi:hypothetical protein